MTTHENILLYRIIHIENLDFILNAEKITCPNHPELNPKYIGIGDKTLIESRGHKEILLKPYGTFRDYNSYYFGPRSPMLLRIKTGGDNVDKREQEEIIYLVTTYLKIKASKIPFVYFDGHGFDALSNCYNNDEGLKNIERKTVYAGYWKDTVEDPHRQRKKQAELLVHKEFPVNLLKEVGVINDKAYKKVRSIIDQNNVNLECKIEREWYYL